LRENSFEGKIKFVYITFIIAVFDWISKYLIHKNFRYGDGKELFDSYFSIVHVHNYGSAFGLFNQGKTTLFNTIFFAVASIIGIFLILFLIREENNANKYGLISLYMLLGGIIGNQGERLFHGFVTDFLDIYINSHHWPAFNIADSAISCGIGIYFLSTYVFGKKPIGTL